MASNPFHVPNASLGQAYDVGPSPVDPRAQTLQVLKFRGHLVSPAPGMLGHLYGIQEGPTMMVSFYYSKYKWSAVWLHEFD
jgi:hypothetical protein